MDNNDHVSEQDGYNLKISGVLDRAAERFFWNFSQMMYSLLRIASDLFRKIHKRSPTARTRLWYKGKYLPENNENIKIYEVGCLNDDSGGLPELHRNCGIEIGLLY